MCNLWNFTISALCQVLSKGFSISNKTRPVGCFFLKPLMMFSTILVTWWMVKCDYRNPNWKLGIIEL